MKYPDNLAGKGGTNFAPAATPANRRPLSPQVAELLAERDGLLPVWIRSPKGGPEHYCGFTRSKLYELAGKGAIRSVSIRAPGQVKGVRLFNLGSILDFITRCEAGFLAARLHSPSENTTRDDPANTRPQNHQAK
jgi:hypothetical protein